MYASLPCFNWVFMYTSASGPPEWSHEPSGYGPAQQHWEGHDPEEHGRGGHDLPLTEEEAELEWQRQLAQQDDAQDGDTWCVRLVVIDALVFVHTVREHAMHTTVSADHCTCRSDFDVAFNVRQHVFISFHVNVVSLN